jgi:hypothetical protein
MTKALALRLVVDVCAGFRVLSAVGIEPPHDGMRWFGLPRSWARGVGPQRSQRNARPGAGERGRQCGYCATAAVMRRRPSGGRKACQLAMPIDFPRLLECALGAGQVGSGS